MKKILITLSVLFVVASCSCFRHHKDECCKGEHKECKDSKSCPMKSGHCDHAAQPTATPTPDTTQKK